MDQQHRTGTLKPPWARQQWRKVVVVVEDHPKSTLSVVLVGLVFVIFYGTQLRGLAHFRESFSRWRVESFGGVHRVERAVRMSDVLLSFRARDYDRLDVLSLTSIHFGGIAFREELEAITRRGGIIRVVMMDPRLSDDGSEKKEAFGKLAEEFGQDREEFRARCWYSTAVILRLSRQLGENLQVRLVSEPIPGSSAPYFSPGRSAHAYMASDPSNRMDIIIPRPDSPSGTDTFTHPASIILDRPDGNPDVDRFTTAFEKAWDGAEVLDETLTQELLKHVNGTQE